MSLPRTLDQPGKGKGYGKSIATESFRDQYEGIVLVDDILDNTEEIALVSTRIHELLGRLTEGGSATLIRKVRQAWQDILAANAQKDADLMRQAQNRMNALLMGKSDDETWEDIYRAIDILSKLTGQETKRRVSMHKVMETDDALGFISKVLFAVKKNVHDPATLRAIQADIQEAMRDHPEVMRNMGGQNL